MAENQGKDVLTDEAKTKPIQIQIQNDEKENNIQQQHNIIIVIPNQKKPRKQRVDG